MPTKSFIVTFGRLNPPTVGHEKLLRGMIEKAKRLAAKPVVFLSQSQDAKNPLTFDEKAKIVKSSLPVLTIGPKTIKNPFDALKWAQLQGAKTVTLLVGEDRLDDFKRMVQSFKKNEDPKDIIDVKVTFIDRKDNISATMARSLARQGDVTAFKRVLMSGPSDREVKDILSKIRTRLGPLKEGTIMTFTELDIDDEESGFFDFVIEESDVNESSQFVITLLEADDKDEKSDKKPKSKKSKDSDEDDDEENDDDGEDTDEDKFGKSKDKDKSNKDDDSSDEDSDDDSGDSDDEKSDDDKKSKKKSPFPPKKKDSKAKAPGDKEPGVPEKKGPAKGKGTNPANDVDNVNLNDGPVDSDVEGNEAKLVLNPPEKLKFVLSQKIASQQDDKSAK